MAAIVKIAIIGGGISGITAAEVLQSHHEVTLFESSARLGGHACPVLVEDRLEIDTAFLIFNEGSYTQFRRLLKRWHVADKIMQTEMSFSFHNQSSGLKYAINKKSFPLIPSFSALLKPSFYRIFPDLYKFYRSGKSYLNESGIGNLSIAAFLNSKGYSKTFVENFLFPLSMAVWSTPLTQIENLPAQTFLRFFDNHRCLGGDLRNYRWCTLRGSSAHYLRAFEKSFRGRIFLNRPVRKIVRTASGVRLLFDHQMDQSIPQNTEDIFDEVIIATHADQALRLLENPSESETQALGGWRYHQTKMFLHNDPAFMPDRNLWSSWNTFFGPAASTSWITYYLNKIQNFAAEKDYFVTLSSDVRPRHIVREFDIEHPILDALTTERQVHLAKLVGENRTSFCGSYFGYGFHEDAVQSALHVAARFGCSLPEA